MNNFGSFVSVLFRLLDLGFCLV